MLSPNINKYGWAVKAEIGMLHFCCAIILEKSVPSQWVNSEENVPSFYFIVILYPVIGDPFESGAFQLIIMSLPITDVVGAIGSDGLKAAFKVRLDVYTESPKAFLT